MRKDVPESFSRMSFALAFVELARQARQTKQDTSQLLSHHVRIVLVQMVPRILVASPNQDSSKDPGNSSAAELIATASDDLTLLSLGAIRSWTRLN
jgi:hypothetical protein